MILMKHNFSRGHHEEYFEFGPAVLSFKDIYYLELWWRLCLTVQNHMCNFGREYHEEHREIILNLDQWFKDNSYLELWQPICSAERNSLCNFGIGHNEEHFSEIIMNLDQWFRRMCCLKDISYLELAAPYLE